MPNKFKMNKSKLSNFDNAALFALYSSLLGEMLTRGLVRTTNNPVADYGEYVACKELNLTRVDANSFKGYDATDSNGLQYQIKSRRNTARNKSCQLGVIRDLDKRPFDFLVAVIFNEDFSVQAIWKIPIEIIEDNSKYSKHQNGHILILRGRVLTNPKAERIF